jgi:hypothetical protein
MLVGRQPLLNVTVGAKPDGESIAFGEAGRHDGSLPAQHGERLRLNGESL